MVSELLTAIHFAAQKHRDQRRKGASASPYINHPIEVAELLARVGGVTDRETLLAAVLHDTVEDTETTPEELAERFGAEVRDLVMEVTDDKSLPKAERKRLQIEHARQISDRAKRIKLADKIANVQDIATSPPEDWPVSRKIEYFDWSEQVVAGLRGSSPPLERLYDEALGRGRKRVG